MANKCLSIYIPFFLLFQVAGTRTYSQADSILVLDAVQVEAYQITGRLRSIPGSLSMLTGTSLGLSDGTNMAYVLNSLPGVSMQSGTYITNRIVIRGMGSRTPYNTNRIRSYLNDIPYTGSDGISTPEEIDLQSIGRLELVKGPSSALYGSGLGGNINMYTTTDMINRGIAGLQYGAFNTAKINVSGTLQSNKFRFSGNLGHLQSDGYRENNTYKRTSLFTAAEWKQSSWSLGLTLLLMQVDGGIPSSLGETMFINDPQAAAPGWKAVGGYEKYVKGLAGITLTNRLSDHLTNRLTLFTRLHNSYEKRPFNNLDDQTASLGLRDKLTLHFDKTDWVFGTEYIAEAYEWTLDTNSVGISHNRENRNQLNVFAMVYYRPHPKVNLSLAGAVNHIRYRLTDLYMNNGDQSGSRVFPLIVSPRIGINYSPAETWAIYASAGHGFSMPSPEETLLPEGDVNPDIEPEQGLQFELGSRLSFFDNTLGIDGSVYWIELNNLLVTKRITEDVFTGINAGKSRHQGIELMVNARIMQNQGFPGKMTTVFTYTRSWNRFIDFTDDEITYDGKNLPGIPEQTVYLQVAWNPFRIFGLSVDIRYNGDQFLDDGNAMEYEGYLIADMKLSAELKTRKAGKFSFYAGINNLANTHYASMLIVNAESFNNTEPRYYYPGLPRHMYAGMQYFL
jgi:iron complex outermembrane receptor protein